MTARHTFGGSALDRFVFEFEPDGGGEQGVVADYFDETPATAGAGEQATDPGGDLPGSAGVEAPQTWMPTKDEWDAQMAQFAAVTQAAEQQRLAASAQAWALRAGPEAVDRWIAEQHWAADDRAQEQALVEQTLNEADAFARSHVAELVASEGFDGIDTEAILTLANEAVPLAVEQVGEGPEAAMLALEEATRIYLEASPEGQARLNTSFLVDRFARDGFGRPTGADVGKVVADAGGKVNEGLVGKFGPEVAVAEALYRAAGGQEHNVAQKWTTIHAALREMNNGRKALAPSVTIDWGRRP